MRIAEIDRGKKAYLPLLLLADEQEEMIDRYLDRGEMFVLEDESGALAVIVVTDEGDGVLEIKNLAVAPQAQGRGYGRAMIDFIAERYPERYHTLLVGTGDSPLTVPFTKDAALPARMSSLISSRSIMIIRSSKAACCSKI